MSNRSVSNKVKTLTIGGVMLALSMISLFLASFVPGVELSLFALSSFFTAAVLMETGRRGGWLFYAATILLTFFLVPNKGAALLYGAFFGLYALVKYEIEQIGKEPVEIGLKLCFFAVSGAGMLLFFRELFLGAVSVPEEYPVWLLCTGAGVVFLVFDYVFTLVIGFYKSRIHSHS